MKRFFLEYDRTFTEKSGLLYITRKEQTFISRYRWKINDIQ